MENDWIICIGYVVIGVIVFFYILANIFAFFDMAKRELGKDNKEELYDSEPTYTKYTYSDTSNSSSPKIRICRGTSCQDVYCIEDNKIYSSCSSIYDPKYVIDDNRVYSAPGPGWGSVVYTIEGNKVYRGMNTYSENIVYTIEGNNILRCTG